MNQTATATATAAITSPWWLPALHSFSSFAAELAPILGAAFLILQIVSKVRRMVKGTEDKNED